MRIVRNQTDVTNTRNTILLRRVRQECKQRILKVCDLENQINLLTIAVVNLFSPAELLAFKALVQWKKQMRQNILSIIQNGLDETVDANWPVCPPEAITLINVYG